MTQGKPLTWSLVVSTYNRPNLLKHCVELALLQSCPPLEIVVVDASTTWRETSQNIEAIVRERLPQVHLVYVPANKKSLTVQRNQGIALASADIVFLIDDDSLMYSDCAAEIMTVYAADKTGEIVGVQATLSDRPPPGANVSEKQKVAARPGVFHWLRSGISRLNWIRKEVLLLDAVALFVPYDCPPAWDLKFNNPAIAATSRTHLFHGCRMTFRREIISKETFNSILSAYCPGEDLDASYRVSRHGILLTANGAMLHHYQGEAGRANPYKVTLLSVLNQAVCIRMFASNLSVCRHKLRILNFRRLIAEALKDALSLRWSFPQTRGLIVALTHMRDIFEVPAPHLENWYSELQTKVLEGK